MNEPRSRLVVAALLLLAGVLVASALPAGDDPLIRPEDAEPATSVPEAVFPEENWTKRDPRSLGMNAELIAEFRDRVGWGSYGCIVRKGYVVKRWDTWIPPIIADRRGWASATKPFLATLALFAVQEDSLAGLDLEVENFGWDLRRDDADMTLRHLANMTSGYSLSESPGEAFSYNDYGTKLFFLTLLNRVYQVPPDNPEAVRSLVSDQDRLGDLEFDESSMFSLRHGMVRLNMSACDFARFGLLLLRDGRWKGEQLIDPELLDRYFRPSVPSQMELGDDQPPEDYLDVGTIGGDNHAPAPGPGVFGFFWWFNEDRALWPDVPDGAFQANGHWNRQSLTVIPSLDLVVAWRESANLASTAENFHRKMNWALEPLVEAVERP